MFAVQLTGWQREELLLYAGNGTDNGLLGGGSRLSFVKDAQPNSWQMSWEIYAFLQALIWRESQQL